MDLAEKLEILADSAKYDVACTSSGVDRPGRHGALGSSAAAGICHAFTADGRCVSLLKVLYSNVCSYDCSYCVNRRSNDRPRATFTPRELAELTIGFYRRNYIEGLFLSSAVLGTPDRTMELMIEALRILREEYHFNGYIRRFLPMVISWSFTRSLTGLSGRLAKSCICPFAFTWTPLSAVIPKRIRRKQL